MGNDTNIFDQLFAGIPDELLFSTVAGMIISCLFMAFFSYKLLKLEIVFSGISLGFSFGHDVLGMAIGESIEGFNVSIVLGIVCAILFALLAIKVYKALIYLYGGLIGALLGFAVPMALISAFVDFAIIPIIVGIVCAIAVAVPFAKLFYKKIFKPFYILASSFAGMMFTAMFAAYLILGNDDISVLAVSMLVGLILAIPAMIFQFKINKGRTLDD